jgi:TolB protein
MRTNIVGRTGAVTVVACALVTSPIVAGPASATYPGEDGRLYFGVVDIAAGRSADVYSVRPSGAGLRQETEAGTGQDLCPAVSADGRRVAFCSNRSGFNEVWTMDAGGGHVRQLTRLEGTSTFPDWSPDGRLVAFAHADLGPAGQLRETSRIWVANPRTGRVSLLVPASPEPGLREDRHPAFSPNGKSVVFVRRGLERQPDGSVLIVSGQLWRYDLRTGASTQLTFDDTLKDQVPDWSPDGRRIAYHAGDDIWVMRADGSHQRNLTATPDVVEIGAAWSPEEDRIAFLGGGPGVPEGVSYVQVMCADGSNRHVVVATPGFSHAVPGWQPVPRGHH